MAETAFQHGPIWFRGDLPLYPKPVLVERPSGQCLGPPSPPGLQVAFSIRAQNAPSFSLSAKSLVIQVNVTPVFLLPPR